MEADIDLIHRLIEAECVEGIVRQNGTIKRLRMLYEELETISRIAAKAQKHEEKPGSIVSGASKTVFNQALPSGHKAWTLKHLSDGWNRQSLLRAIA